MKEDHENDQVSIACVLSAMTTDQREAYNQLLKEISKRCQEVSELSDGYVASFPEESSMIIKLTEFISLERLCCPFLKFELSVKSNNPIWLRFTGPKGVKKFLRTTFFWLDKNQI